MANLRQVTTDDQVDREAESIKRFLKSENEPVIIAWGTPEGMESYKPGLEPVAEALQKIYQGQAQDIKVTSTREGQLAQGTFHLGVYTYSFTMFWNKRGELVLFRRDDERKDDTPW
ncbi:hypothetical protein ES703_14603 [subsurface metagenome]